MPGAGHDTSDASHGRMPINANAKPGKIPAKIGKVANVLKPQIAPHKWVPNGFQMAACHLHATVTTVLGKLVQQNIRATVPVP